MLQNEHETAPQREKEFNERIAKEDEEYRKYQEEQAALQAALESDDPVGEDIAIKPNAEAEKPNAEADNTG